MKIRDRLEIALWFLIVDVTPTFAFGLVCYVIGYHFGLSGEGQP